MRTALLHTLAVTFGLISISAAFHSEPKAPSLFHRRPLDSTLATASSILFAMPPSDPKHVEKVLFVECGFGADAHGQDSTKAAVRACRNAIEFNQLPSIADLVPGGRSEMKLDVLLAVPTKYQEELDLDAVRAVFPYGRVKIQIQDGGMVANHGKMIEELGDKNEDMVVVCVAVTVGY